MKYDFTPKNNINTKIYNTTDESENLIPNFSGGANIFGNRYKSHKFTSIYKDDTKPEQLIILAEDLLPIIKTFKTKNVFNVNLTTDNEGAYKTIYKAFYYYFYNTLYHLLKLIPIQASINNSIKDNLNFEYPNDSELKEYTDFLLFPEKRDEYTGIYDKYSSNATKYKTARFESKGLFSFAAKSITDHCNIKDTSNIDKDETIRKLDNNTQTGGDRNIYSIKHKTLESLLLDAKKGITTDYNLRKGKNMKCYLAELRYYQIAVNHYLINLLKIYISITKNNSPIKKKINSYADFVENLKEANVDFPIPENIDANNTIPSINIDDDEYISKLLKYIVSHDTDTDRIIEDYYYKNDTDKQIKLNVIFSYIFGYMGRIFDLKQLISTTNQKKVKDDINKHGSQKWYSSKNGLVKSTKSYNGYLDFITTFNVGQANTTGKDKKINNFKGYEFPKQRKYKSFKKFSPTKELYLMLAIPHCINTLLKYIEKYKSISKIAHNEYGLQHYKYESNLSDIIKFNTQISAIDFRNKKRDEHAYRFQSLIEFDFILNKTILDFLNKPIDGIVDDYFIKQKQYNYYNLLNFKQLYLSDTYRSKYNIYAMLNDNDFELVYTTKLSTDADYNLFKQLTQEFTTDNLNALFNNYNTLFENGIELPLVKRSDGTIINFNINSLTNTIMNSLPINIVSMILKVVLQNPFMININKSKEDKEADKFNTDIGAISSNAFEAYTNLVVALEMGILDFTKNIKLTNNYDMVYSTLPLIIENYINSISDTETGNYNITDIPTSISDVLYSRKSLQKLNDTCKTSLELGLMSAEELLIYNYGESINYLLKENPSFGKVKDTVRYKKKYTRLQRINSNTAKKQASNAFQKVPKSLMTGGRLEYIENIPEFSGISIALSKGKKERGRALDLYEKRIIGSAGNYINTDNILIFIAERKFDLLPLINFITHGKDKFNIDSDFRIKPNDNDLLKSVYSDTMANRINFLKNRIFELIKINNIFINDTSNPDAYYTFRSENYIKNINPDVYQSIMSELSKSLLTKACMFVKLRQYILDFIKLTNLKNTTDTVKAIPPINIAEIELSSDYLLRYFLQTSIDKKFNTDYKFNEILESAGNTIPDFASLVNDNLRNEIITNLLDDKNNAGNRPDLTGSLVGFTDNTNIPNASIFNDFDNTINSHNPLHDNDSKIDYINDNVLNIDLSKNDSNYKKYFNGDMRKLASYLRDKKGINDDNKKICYDEIYKLLMHKISIVVLEDNDTTPTGIMYADNFKINIKNGNYNTIQYNWSLITCITFCIAYGYKYIFSTPVRVPDFKDCKDFFRYYRVYKKVITVLNAFLNRTNDEIRLTTSMSYKEENIPISIKIIVELVINKYLQIIKKIYDKGVENFNAVSEGRIVYDKAIDIMNNLDNLLDHHEYNNLIDNIYPSKNREITFRRFVYNVLDLNEIKSKYYNTTTPPQEEYQELEIFNDNDNYEFIKEYISSDNIEKILMNFSKLMDLFTSSFKTINNGYNYLIIYYFILYLGYGVFGLNDNNTQVLNNYNDTPNQINFTVTIETTTNPPTISNIYNFDYGFIATKFINLFSKGSIYHNDDTPLDNKLHIMNAIKNIRIIERSITVNNINDNFTDTAVTARNSLVNDNLREIISTVNIPDYIKNTINITELIIKMNVINKTINITIDHLSAIRKVKYNLYNLLAPYSGISEVFNELVTLPLTDPIPLQNYINDNTNLTANNKELMNQLINYLNKQTKQKIAIRTSSNYRKQIRKAITIGETGLNVISGGEIIKTNKQHTKKRSYYSVSKMTINKTKNRKIRVSSSKTKRNYALRRLFTKKNNS